MSAEDKDQELKGAFRDLFENESTPPPKAAWKQVRTAIAVEKRMRIFRRFMYCCLVATVVVSTVLIGWHYAGQNGKQRQSEEQNEKESGNEMQSGKETLYTANEAGKEEPQTRDSSTEGQNRQQNERNKENSGTNRSASSKNLSSKNNSTLSLTTNKTEKHIQRYSDEEMSHNQKAKKTPNQKDKPAQRSKDEKEIRTQLNEGKTGSSMPLPGKSASPEATILTEQKENESESGNESKKELQYSPDEHTKGEGFQTDPTTTAGNIKEPTTATENKKVVVKGDSIGHLPFKPAPWIPSVTPDPRAMAPIINPALMLKRLELEFFAGIGKNRRVIHGNFMDNYRSHDLLSSKVNLNNRFMGVTAGYRFNRWFSVHAGLTFGKNTYTSRWFYKLLDKKDAGDSYDFNTADGQLRMASSDVTDYFQSSDSVLFRARVHHNSSYLSIPLSAKFTLPTAGLAPYIRLGVSYDLQLRNRTTLLLKTDEMTRAVQLVQPGIKDIRNNLVLFGLGFETTKSPVRFFFEPQFSFPLSALYKTENFKIKSVYTQLKVGITFSF